MVVSIDRDGDRVMVLSRRLPVTMIRVGGNWERGIFSADELKDFFVRASDSEAETLFRKPLPPFGTTPCASEPYPTRRRNADCWSPGP